MPLGKDAGLGFDISGCQNYGPFLGPYDNSAPIIKGTQKRGHNFDNQSYVGMRRDPEIGTQVLFSKLLGGSTSLGGRINKNAIPNAMLLLCCGVSTHPNYIP